MYRAALRKTTNLLIQNAKWEAKMLHISGMKHSKSKVWSLGKINHIALVTPNLEKSTALYRDVLGANVSGQQPLPDHGVTVVFVELGDTKIELLHPLGEKSPISSFMEKNKSGGMHHICIEVDDIESAMKDLKAQKIRLLSDKAKIGAHGKPVVFLHPKDCDGVLVELEEAGTGRS
ncbi:hypothetical protein EGW08_018759 [Elysia chlorotica]|uniref:Methylmalonyl-CoA epimerase, mitochondrial n=1 Tax=Elysia chlorotica TaxID=188477 RepID=A0A3S0ZRC5_ELYCH|nr:hypothetical protein EGW08_018759 [Elysia chlorotica]